MSKDKRVVCLGDSITWGFPFGPNHSWVKMLSESIPATFINEGINGDTTGNMLRRFDKSVLRHRPTHVVIMGGINDVMLRESLDRIQYNMLQILDRAEAHDLQVILGIPTAVDYPEAERRLEKLRQWLRREAEARQIPLIDFSQAFFYPDGSVRTDLLLPDGGHPTKEGYQEMFKHIDLTIF